MKKIEKINNRIEIPIPELVRAYSFDERKCKISRIGKFGEAEYSDLPKCVKCMRRFREKDIDVPCIDSGNLQEALFSEKHNVVTTAFLNSVAKRIGGLGADDDTCISHYHAIGTSNSNTSGSDTSMNYELYRKGHTGNYRSGNTVTLVTFFGTGDYTNSWATVMSGTSTTEFTTSGTPSGSWYANDYVRVGLDTGNEFVTVSSISGTGNHHTLSITPALTKAPSLDDEIDQVTAESGMFGNLAASYITGKAGWTSGSTTISGSGTTWSTNTYSGTKIRPQSGSDERSWSTITAVDSDTQLTVSSAPDFTVGMEYFFEGTMFNHVNDMDFVKSNNRTVVLETAWTITSA